MEPIREAEMQTQPGKRLNEESKKSGKGPLLIAGIVLSRHTDRLLLSREMREMLRSTAERLHTRIFESAIRESVVVRESQAMRQSIFRYAARSKQTEDYDRFALEYLKYAGYLKNQ